MYGEIGITAHLHREVRRQINAFQHICKALNQMCVQTG